MRIRLHRWCARQATGVTAATINDPKICAVRENDVRITDVGLAE
jgi:hypothetical protein